MTTAECILVAGLCQLAILMAILFCFRRLTGEVTKLLTVTTLVLRHLQRDGFDRSFKSTERGR